MDFQPSNFTKDAANVNTPDRMRNPCSGGSGRPGFGFLHLKIDIVSRCDHFREAGFP